MSNTNEARVYRELAQAARLYREALFRAGCQLDSRALLNRADAVEEEAEVMRENAEHIERKARKPARVLPFRKPAPRVQSAVEEADWLGGMP